MTKVLAIETATDACSAAIAIGNRIIERFEIAPRQHTDLILPMIDQLLAEAQLRANDLDVIAFGAGPGSFTGVRIATSIAQGIGLAHDLPLVPLSCLEMLALGGARAHQMRSVTAVLDARKQQIYAARYEVDLVNATATSVVADWMGEAEALDASLAMSDIVVGNGCEPYYEILLARGVRAETIKIEPRFPHARDALAPALARLRDNSAVAPELAQPIYLRRAV